MNIYVGNLSYSTTEDELRDLFAQYGEISRVTIIQDRETNRSKGFGFVEMPDQSSAEAAIKGLNAQDYGSRTLRINEARPREQRKAW